MGNILKGELLAKDPKTSAYIETSEGDTLSQPLSVKSPPDLVKAVNDFCRQVAKLMPNRKGFEILFWIPNQSQPFHLLKPVTRTMVRPDDVAHLFD